MQPHFEGTIDKSSYGEHGASGQFASHPVERYNYRCTLLDPSTGKLCDGVFMVLASLSAHMVHRGECFYNSENRETNLILGGHKVSTYLSGLVKVLYRLLKDEG